MCVWRYMCVWLVVFERVYMCVEREQLLSFICQVKKKKKTTDKQFVLTCTRENIQNGCNCVYVCGQIEQITVALSS